MQTEELGPPALLNSQFLCGGFGLSSTGKFKLLRTFLKGPETK